VFVMELWKVIQPTATLALLVYQIIGLILNQDKWRA